MSTSWTPPPPGHPPPPTSPPLETTTPLSLGHHPLDTTTTTTPFLDTTTALEGRLGGGVCLGREGICLGRKRGGGLPWGFAYLGTTPRLPARVKGQTPLHPLPGRIENQGSAVNQRAVQHPTGIHSCING